MEITIKSSPEEIADLVLTLQGQLGKTVCIKSQSVIDEELTRSGSRFDSTRQNQL